MTKKEEKKPSNINVAEVARAFLNEQNARKKFLCTEEKRIRAAAAAAAGEGVFRIAVEKWPFGGRSDFSTWKYQFSYTITEVKQCSAQLVFG